MKPIFNFSVHGRSFQMSEQTIISMSKVTNPKVKAIYDAGIKCIEEYKEVEQTWKENHREEQDEIDFALEHDMLDDISRFY